MAKRTKVEDFKYDFCFRIDNGPIHNFNECTEDELNELKERLSDKLANALGYHPEKYIYYDPNEDFSKSRLVRFM